MATITSKDGTKIGFDKVLPSPSSLTSGNGWLCSTQP